jgi:hypothetical protein
MNHLRFERRILRIFAVKNCTLLKRRGEFATSVEVKFTSISLGLRAHDLH